MNFEEQAKLIRRNRLQKVFNQMNSCALQNPTPNHVEEIVKGLMSCYSSGVLDLEETLNFPDYIEYLGDDEWLCGEFMQGCVKAFIQTEFNYQQVHKLIWSLCEYRKEQG